MTKADQTIERAADWLQKRAETFAGGNGLKGKLAQPLAEDAAFLRKLKPSLMAARARGEAPTNQKPGSGTVAPSPPQLGERPKPLGAKVLYWSSPALPSMAGATSRITTMLCVTFAGSMFFTVIPTKIERGWKLILMNSLS